MWRTAIALIVVAPSAALAADLIQVARQTGNYTQFIEIVDRAQLTGELSGGGPYTVFMPSDVAFERMPPETMKRLSAVDGDVLRPIVLQHVIRGVALPSDDIPKTLKTAGGGELQVTWELNGLNIYSGPVPPVGEKARVVRGDLTADNGVVHTIDAILLPVDALEIQGNVADASTGAAGTPPPDATPARDAGQAAPPKPPAQSGTVRERPPVKVYTYGPGADTAAVVMRPAQPERPAGQPTAEGAPRSPALTVDELDDMAVVSRGRDAEGYVEGVVLSPGSGDIDLVLVRFSGFLGMFGKLVAVPWSDITVARGQPLLIADLDVPTIEQAEEVDVGRYRLAD